MQIWGVLTDLVGFYISSFVIFKRRGSTALLQSFSSFFTLEKNTDLTLLRKKKTRQSTNDLEDADERMKIILF